MVAPALGIVALSVVLLVVAGLSEAFGSARRKRQVAVWCDGPNGMATGRIRYSRRFLRQLRKEHEKDGTKEKAKWQAFRRMAFDCPKTGTPAISATEQQQRREHLHSERKQEWPI